MAIKMVLGGEKGFVDQNLAKDINAYLDAKAKNDFNAFNTYVDGNYDSSGDYWRLMRDGTLVNNNSGWLTDEDGRPILNANGERIGAGGIETGLLNILFGGTHNVGYDEYSDEQIGFVQGLMISALMNYTEGENDDIRSRSWKGNATGQSLNMQQIMEGVGNTVAATVFARYYEDSAFSILAYTRGKDIGDTNDILVSANVISRFGGLYSSILDNYETKRHFFNNPERFRVTGKHGEMDPKYLYPNYENDAHFGTDLAANGRSGDSIYMGISGKVIHTEAESAPDVGNGNWMVVEYGYLFEGSFIGSGIYGEYMHMERRPNFNINSYLDSNQVIGTVGNTGHSDGAHLHYSIYTLENYYYSQTTLRLLLNNNISNTVSSRNAAVYTGTYNNRAARKVTYDIENYLRGLR
jgi:murein DD-endopeptidase MepM/ murein hydrolase activator NlpD